jgi:hypothetical protein
MKIMNNPINLINNSYTNNPLINRVDRPINPTNQIKSGIRQGLFLYNMYNLPRYLNLTRINYKT